MKRNKLPIVVMTQAHVNGVDQISRESFSKPWSKDAWKQELYNQKGVTFVALSGETVAGFANLHMVLDEANLNNIAVLESYRRQGIAGALLETAMAFLRTKGVTMLYLEVRQSNEQAIRLYENAGFQRIGIRKRFYEKPVEDAVLMTVSFGPKEDEIA